MNINESLFNKLKALREDANFDTDELDIKDIDDSDLEEFDSFEEPDFGEETVEAGNHFNLDGDDFIWSKPFSDVAEVEGQRLLVWKILDDYTDEELYVVVDIDDGELEYGPVDTMEDARETLDIFKDNADIDEALITEGKVQCGDYSLVLNKDKSYSVFKESKELCFRNKDDAKSCFIKGIKKAEKSLKEAVNNCINVKGKTLSEDFVVMLPQGFELNWAQEIQMPECPCDTCNDLGMVADSAARVMEAYQNANKWLDTIKEFVYSDLSCVFFSSFIHGLAHTMPGRFDKFGDILHTMNIKVPYPATLYIPQEPQNINDVFNLVFMVLDAIKASLNDFIKCTDENFHGAACAAETLLNDIESEYPMWYRLKKEWELCGEDNIKFDKYVNQYVKNKDDLLESLNEHWKSEYNQKENPTDSWEVENIEHTSLTNDELKKEVETWAEDDVEAFKNGGSSDKDGKFEYDRDLFIDNCKEEGFYNINKLWSIYTDKCKLLLNESLNEKANRFPTMEKRKYTVICANKDEHEVYATSEKDAWDEAEKKYNNVENVYFDESLNEDIDNYDYIEDYLNRLKSAGLTLVDTNTSEDPVDENTVNTRTFVNVIANNDSVLSVLNDLRKHCTNSPEKLVKIKKALYKNLPAEYDESLNEDTKKEGNHWVNKGDEGTHGKFKTKKAADAQRKAMFANGYTEALNEGELDYPELENALSKEECKQEGWMIGNVPYTWLPRDIKKIFDWLGFTDEELDDAEAGNYLMDFDTLKEGVEGALDYDEGQQEEIVLKNIFNYLNDLGWKIKGSVDTNSRAAKQLGRSRAKKSFWSLD